MLLAAAIGLSALAAKPLTPAERTVCRSLSHCLSIVDEHPFDSFDYTVLAEEFRRFGPKGRDALIKRVRKGESSAEARHAADLLALSRNASALPPLKALSERGKPGTRALAQRTHEALSLRLRAKPAAAAVTSARPLPTGPLACRAQPVDPTAQRREMPFFEADVAQPDAFGAYRPSARHRIALPATQRAALRSAVAVPGGWLAGYSGGLVRYNDADGTPRVESDASVLSLQRRVPDRIDGGVWAVLDAPGGLLIADALALTVTARMPGALSGLARADDGTLYVGSSAGLIVGLRPDGGVLTGCENIP